jgi:2-hydroxy-3-oxopropionate reductase
VTKAANQLIVAGEIAVLGEAVVLLERSGIDPRRALEALSSGLAGSRILEAKGPKVVDREFSATFALGLHDKDMGIVLAIADATHCCLPVAATVGQILSAAVANGWAGLDDSAMVRVVDLLSGTDNNESELNH